jgi:hypothetical protein
MRKFLMVLGGVAAAVGAVVIGGFIFLAATGSSLDAESKAYVDASVQAITRNWDREEFLARASPELMATLKPGDASQLFASLSQLGGLVEYQGATGQAKMFYTIGTGNSTTAEYVAKARYQNGDAAIRISIRKYDDGTWKILGFHVDIVPGATIERRT